MHTWLFDGSNTVVSNATAATTVAKRSDQKTIAAQYLERGVDVVPEQLRKRLQLSGDDEATLVMTRVAGVGTALLVEDEDLVRLSTAEMLAQYLGQRVRQELDRSGYTHLTLLELEVEENYGQSATYRETLGD